MIGEYLSKTQPIVFNSFKNALVRDRLVHAYLLSGEAGAPLIETALFLAKSLVCDDPSPLADETCRTCARIENGNYPDLIVLDGSDGSIKKKDVEEIVDNFNKSALDKKGIMIYVIHLVENMTEEAINSLLKFLEEPSKGTFAFLTTQNETKVLPTIISRCVRLRMFLVPRKDVIIDAVSSGVDKSDAEILSYFTNRAEDIKKLSEAQSYGLAKEAFEITLDALSENGDKAIFLFESKIIPMFGRGGGGKEEARLYYDMLSLIFKDLINKSKGQNYIMESYEEKLNKLSALKHIDESLVEIMVNRSQLDLNINLATLLDHTINYITKEE